MADAPLMPKATAVWLLDNTTLTFEQIADFCKLHPLEVKAIADGEAAQGIKGIDPVLTGQLTRDELDQAIADPKRRLQLVDTRFRAQAGKRRGPRYTPVSKRQDRPNAIRWLIRNHPELKDSQIIRLVGTTKTTIEAIREGTHWNAQNLSPVDPVTLGLCTQIALDMEVQKANKGRQVTEEEKPTDTLIPAAESQHLRPKPEGQEKPSETVSADSVFAKFSNLGRS
jgi:hypothetical protein